MWLDDSSRFADVEGRSSFHEHRASDISRSEVALMIEGRGATLTVDALRFSRVEIATFLGERLPRREFNAVVATTAGWPIALRMVRNAREDGMSATAEGDALAAWIEARLWRGLSEENRALAETGGRTMSRAGGARGGRAGGAGVPAHGGGDVGFHARPGGRRRRGTGDGPPAAAGHVERDRLQAGRHEAGRAGGRGRGRDRKAGHRPGSARDVQFRAVHGAERRGGSGRRAGVGGARAHAHRPALAPCAAHHL